MMHGSMEAFPCKWPSSPDVNQGQNEAVEALQQKAAHSFVALRKEKSVGGVQS